MDRQTVMHLDYTVGCLRTHGQTESDTGKQITLWDFSLHVDRQRVTQVDRLQCGETRGQTEIDVAARR